MTIHPIKQKILNIYGHEPQSLDQLAECVIAVANTRNTVLGFKWSMFKSHRVSNSHCAPLNGISNWAKNADKPTGYPGWNGRIWIRYAKIDSFSNDPLQETLTHTGTGGSGGYDGPWQKLATARYEHFGKPFYDKAGKYVFPIEPRIYSYDYKFFDHDWPEIYKYELFKLIKNSRITHHEFEWYDEATVNAADEFLALCASLVDSH